MNTTKYGPSEISGLPDFFYHGTSTACLASILAEGIIPSPSHDNPERTCVYLTDDRCLAEIYAELACDRRGGKAVVIKLDARNLDPGTFEPDDYDLQDQIDDLHDPDRDGEIGALSGMQVDERLRPFRRWQDVPFQLSLSVTRQIAYRTAVRPTFILNLEPLKRLADEAPAPPCPVR